MKSVVTRTVNDEELAALRRPRQAPARERRVDDDHFALDLGPFREYERHLEVTGAPGADGRRTVTETVTYRLAIPLWGFLFLPFIKRMLRQPDDAAGSNWLPSIDARAATSLSLLCIFSVYAGYLGVLLSQTNAFFQREFGSSNTEISDAAIALRVGAFAAVAVVAVADRQGRRRVLVVSTFLALVLAATGAFAPDLFWLSVSQGLARVFSAAVGILLLVVATEEVPAGARAFSVSMLTMSAALGAGGVVAFLWIGDLGVGAWRAFYLVPLPFLLTLPLLRRHLPESRRFEIYELREEEVHERSARADTRRVNRRRLAIVGGANLFLAVFTIPAAFYTNLFLQNERGFSAGQITIFQLATNIPGGISLIIGGLLADRYGRRLIGSIGLLGGTGAAVWLYLSSGPWIWVASTIATVLGALVVPALLVYQSELFPTGHRSRSNGIITLLTVVGAVIGLRGAGVLSDHYGGFGPAMAILAVGSILATIVVVAWYPETADKELEELNPEDIAPPADAAELALLDEQWVTTHEHGREPGSPGPH